MKSFRKKICYLFFPIVIVYSAYIFHDYNDYWGVRWSFDNYKGLIIYRFRSFLRDPKKGIILGDSRVAHFDRTAAPVLPIDSEYTNLAFGGASLKECIHMFWWAAQNQKLENVIFSISFYTMNQNYMMDRFFERLKLAERPGEYLVNLEYMELSIKDLITTFTAPAEETADSITSEEAHQKYADVIRSVVRREYDIDRNIIQELRRVAEFCKKNSINLVFVTPPTHKMIWTRVIDDFGLRDNIAEYKQTLSELAPYLDLEYPDNLWTAAHGNDFSDGFHMKPNSKGFLEFKKAIMEFPERSLQNN